MWRRVRNLAGRLGRLEKAFLAAAAAYLAAWALSPGGLAATLFAVAAVVLGAGVLLRAVRFGIRRTIWRLRNRLLVAYVFIGVVPVVLLAALVGIGAFILTGQIAIYLVTTGLERRTSGLIDAAQGLAATPAGSLGDRLRWIGPYLRDRHPGLEMLVRRGGAQWRYPEEARLAPPPRGWGDSAGPLLKDGALYLWAHSVKGPAEVTLLAPLDPEILARLSPGVGDVSIIAPAAPAGGRRPRIVYQGKEYRPEVGRSRLPPPAHRLDREVDYISPVALAVWETPNRTEKRVLFIRTRCSAVLRTVFGQTVEWREGVTMAYAATVLFLAVAGAFLVVELVSLLIGVNLTRTITRAVHELYRGTQQVMQGDFSHRIEVRGQDQLAELGRSFNRMTENLERLLAVAKEKERLQSELEIAREVQNQLFPRAVPEARTLRLTACCRPARLVSGDYYDYMSLPDSRVAMAIGDVAGKGISAALLMATLQSSMRAQLRTQRELAAAAGDGSAALSFSTAALVSCLNQHLYAYTPPEKFATFYFAVYDDATGRLVYTNAGHPPPVLIRRGQPLRLEINGTVVGAFPSVSYGESMLRLQPGDLLVCFTDGVTEPENEYGEMFGEQRLIELLLSKADSDGEEILAAVAEAVRQWTGSAELQDDMTMLLARRL